MWEKIHSVHQLQTGAAFPLNYQFSQSILIVKASASNTRLTWNKAGVLYPLLQVPDIGLVQTKAISIHLGSQLIEVVNPLRYQFTTQYKTVDWFIDINLEFWANPDLQAISFNNQVANLNDFAIKNSENVALIQQQLNQIEQNINTTSGQ